MSGALDAKSHLDADNAVDAVPLLVRREIEARIIAPFVAALSERFCPAEVLDALQQTVVQLARQQAATMPMMPMSTAAQV